MNHCASISYTYSEPTIHYEHNRAVGIEARRAGLKNVFVTNGMMTVDVARDAAENFLDGANVDLKAMRSETYREHCKAGKRGLETVLESISELHHRGVWVEVTTLVIPGINDDFEGSAPDMGAVESSPSIFSDGFESGDLAAWSNSVP